ncbi:MAG TPA: C25 family cysteine peptidase [Chitinophagaceae bacterium]|nr:C25 family cysteine peptidase [Chitinophagaceae bacterium]
MKRILLLLLTALTLTAQAQTYNNEWIDYNKTYYKFKVGSTGLYRITQSVLASMGVDGVNAEQFQLWRNGKQIPVYTSAQNGPLGGTGYIEFWGEMNDGKPDNALYRQPEWQLNDKYSLETDTAAFFLTVNPAGNNFRLTPTANDVAGNVLAPEPFFIYTTGDVYKYRLNLGRSELVGNAYTYSSSYDYGEGWTSGDMVTGSTAGYSGTDLHAYTAAGAPNPVIRIGAAGNAVLPRYFKVTLNGDSIYGQTMDYYDYAKVSIPITTALIASNSATILVTDKCALPNDRMVLTNVEMDYARQFHFANSTTFSFQLPANATGNYLEITGFNSLSSTPVLYDLTNGNRYECDISNPALIKVVLQPSAVDRKLVLLSTASSLINPVNGLERRDFVNYALAANQGNYLMITHPVLTGPGGGSDPVEEYRTYRNSAAGGSYNAKVYLTNQLEDQFAFGIRLHPLSIRNFIRWARKNFSNPLKDVLLIGKGVVYTQSTTLLNNPTLDKLDFVPTFGYPASDNLLTAEGASSQPLTPIGRLSVISKDELSTYLSKVKEYEQAESVTSPTIEDKAWTKNVVHVIGGGDVVTSNLLSAALDGQAEVIKDTLYSANVQTFVKNSADAVTQVSGSKLANLFTEGIGILTYFGHSSASTLEFNLDNPQNYSNVGKYPVFIVMGCNAGGFYNYNVARFSTKETLSEKYVLAPKGGSIAFLASTHLGIIHYLDIYNTRLYRALSRTNYGGTLGEIMDEAIKQVFQLTTENDFYARFQCEQFTLHGDPAIRFYHADKPDYVIEDPLVSVSPKFIPVSEPNFKVTAGFLNIGRSPAKNIVVELKRTYPDQTSEVIRRDTILFTEYSDSLSYTLPVVASRDKGLNRITITIDADNDVDEIYETNNSVTKDVYIIEDDIRPVLPYNFAVVNDPNQKVIASTANPFAPLHDYKMEMDTTELFNSPLKISQTKSSSGGIVEFSPGIVYKDSTVYYWRVANLPTAGEPVWNTSSFQYIGNSPTGFSQAHYFQHLKSSLSKLRLVDDRQWKFDSIENNAFVKNGIFGTAITTESELAVNLNDSSYIRNVCAYGFAFNVLDETTFLPWKNQIVGSGGLYGSTSPACAPSRIWNFEYPNTEIGRKRALDFLRMVPDGNFIVVRNVAHSAVADNEYVSNWKHDEVTYGLGNSMYTELKNQGFTQIDSIDRPRAFSFVYKKNHQYEHAPKYVISDGIFDPISLSVDCITPRSIGVISSPKIGPAKAWTQLHWNGTTDPVSGDSPHVDVIGISTDGIESLLLTGLDLTQQDFDISSIDAKQYPYLRLQMQNMDTVHYTPFQLRYWMLTYVPVPEGAIAPNLYFESKDTLEVGEPFTFGMAFKNISKLDFDSLKVKLSITDKQNVENIIPIPRQKNLVAGDTVKIRVPIDTKAFSGHNTLFIDFNPDEDQPEQSLFNNYAFRNLYVRPDSLNPLLDVTFDGVHILNKDIVSSKPAILVKLKDEAKWMVLDDTSLVNVSVKFPDGSLRKFTFTNSNDTLKFIPAGQAPNTNNTASVDFKPYFDQDGEYELIVSGKDRSENTAGNVQYRVAFQVINKPMISNMLNYPNPFTTSTAFVFTVTGSQVPQNIRIQVLTITGKIVRDITKDELGPIHIGRNITEFKWDGTDQYGQKLANGIYLYRVITNLNGKSLDKYKAQDDNTDKYFNKGYGKMYLMR